MRECGTDNAEEAMEGLDLICGLDTLDDRRSERAEAGKYSRINELLVMFESLGSAGGVEDTGTSLGIPHPVRLRAVRKIEFNHWF